MGHAERKKAFESDDVQTRPRKPHIAPPPKPDYNKVRRELYGADPQYAERQREYARRSYRKDNPLQPSRLTDGPLHTGTLREVYVEGMDYPEVVECYTIPEAARALGKTEITFKRWLKEDLIPEPILKDTLRNFRHYSAGEVRVMARVLAQHEQSFSYYAVHHTHTREQMMQQMFGYREHFI
jgi:hypothetical protein